MAQTIINALFSLAVAILSSLLVSTIKTNNRLRQERKEIREKHEKINSNLTLSMARIMLQERMKKDISKGCVTHEDYAITKELYDAYIDGGGNGVIKHLHDQQYDKLPIKED